MNEPPSSPATTPEPNGTTVYWRQKDWLLALALIIVVFLVYKPAWNGGLIWDDNDYITPHDLRSVQGLVRIWTEPGATEQYYPLMHSVLWLEHRLWGDATRNYHFLSLLLHSVSGLLLVRIVRKLALPGAWFAAFLFVLHPVMVESVAWICELKNTLSGVLFLGSVLLYLRFEEKRCWGWHVLSLLLFALALLSKTSAVFLPVALLVVAWWRRGRVDWKGDALPVAPFFLVAIAAGLFTMWVERKFIGAHGEAFGFSIAQRCVIAGHAVWFYLGKLLWPAGLAFIYPRWDMSQSSWWQYLYPVSAVALGVLLWGMRSLSRAPLAVLLYFVAALFPVLGFFNVFFFTYSFVADRFQYLASIGPLVFAAAVITRWAGRLGVVRIIGQAAVCGVFGLLSWKYSHLYADAETMWRHTIAGNPACRLAYSNLAGIQMEQGRSDEALVNLKKTLELEPKDVVARGNLGELLRQLGRLDEAQAELQTALTFHPDNPNVHYNLGVVLLQRGQLTAAAGHFELVLKHQPDAIDAHNNLAVACLGSGQVARAVIEWQEALRLDPQCLFALDNLAWVLATSPDDSLRNGPEAMALATRAVQLTEDGNPMVLRTLAAAYAENGRFAEAIQTAQRALTMSPPGLAVALQEQIKSYQAGTPVRDSSLVGVPSQHPGP